MIRSPARHAAAMLARCRRGVTAVEFALVAPVFMMLLFGLIEGGRMLWLKQTLNEVAFSTARCMSVGTDCPTLAQQRAYAVTRAAGYGVTIAAADITITANTSCDGNANANRIAITERFNSPVLGLLPMLPSTVAAHACFPTLG